MTFRRNIAGFLVLLMFAMQLLLAQHYTVHFNEEEYAFINGHKPANDSQDEQKKQDPDKICQICFFAKDFSQAIYAISVVIPVSISVAEIITSALHHRILRYIALVYSARAPPILH